MAVLDLNDFFYFVHVVDRGGFTAAGRTLRIPKSTLSHRIQQLETKLGVRLLNRTSRRFAITDAGEEFYRHAVVMLREAELADNPMASVAAVAKRIRSFSFKTLWRWY
jgi:DNA-binding transcriptional LysR family regulator